VPEGHTIHRLAASLTERFGGHEVHASSPQGRFVDEATVLDGRILERVRPRGKHLFIEFAGSDSPIVHVHLGLGGRFVVGDAPTPVERGAIRLRLTSETAWADLRGPTICELIDRAGRDRVVRRLGPDLLARRRDVSAVRTRVLRSRMPIGALVMDQQLFNGVGNAFRSELLFRQGLDPWVPGKALTPEEFDGLWEEARRLLSAGRRTGRVSTVDRADLPRGQKRAARRHLPPEDEASGSAVARARARETYVYKRAGLPCRRCGTEVRTDVIAGRDVYWCPACQSARG
jgi:formamidopyrimidine-DNA glycosylase